MRFHFSELCLGALSASLLGGTAFAGPALDEAQPAPDTSSPTEPVAPVAAETPVEYGVGLRIRNVRVPKAILELFVESVPGGASNLGLGVELTRRRGTVEIQLGLEYESITPTEGPWINKNEPVPANEADFILSPEDAGEKLGWFTIEFSFLNHAVINKHLAFRYGGGAGLGILTGNLYRYDVQCAASATNANPEPGCRPMQEGGTGNATSGDTPVKYDLPPVFPVVNAIIGLQIKPVDKLVINIEGGLRTIPFFGTSIGYFF